MAEYHSYEPGLGHGLPHDPLKAIIAPRPIGWISSVDAEGRRNLAPYSFFNMFAQRPPILGFVSDTRKDSVSNIAATREFVFNLVTRPLADAMNISSAPFAHGVDEFEKAGLEAAASTKVRAPRVAATPAAIECKLIEIRQMRDMDGNALDVWLTLGQAVAVHIDRAYLRDGLFDTAAARSLARCGYLDEYAEVSELFRMARPSL